MKFSLSGIWRGGLRGCIGIRHWRSAGTELLQVFEEKAAPLQCIRVYADGAEPRVGQLYNSLLSLLCKQLQTTGLRPFVKEVTCYQVGPDNWVVGVMGGKQGTDG